MSIASELTNLESNIGDAYDAVNDMSGIIPQHKNMANLDQAIRTIPQNAGTTYTAGNGINIDANNEISIDDTVVAELSDLPGVMAGASSSVAGASGLVPAPAIGDQDKVLKGDGTWGAVDAATTTFYVDNLSAGTRTIYSDRELINAVSGNTIKTAFENGRVRIMYTPMSLFSYDEYEVVGIGEIHDTPTTGGTFILSGANNTISLCYSYQSFASTSATLTKKIIPTVNDGTLTIQHNGATIQTFTANQFSAATANIETIWADDAVPATQVPPVTTSLIEDEAVTPAKLSFGKYSTTKQQVGVWIDNRPVYRIVITGTTASATSERVGYPTGVNIGGLVNVYGGLTGTNGYIQPIQRVCADSNVSTFSLGLGDFVNGQFTFHHTAQDYWGADYHIVIEYIEPAA